MFLSQYRPTISALTAIQHQETIAIRCSLTLQKAFLQENKRENTPWDNIAFFQYSDFALRVTGLSQKQNIIFTREYTSDSYGIFLIKIPASIDGNPIKSIEVYETAYNQGVEFHLGDFIPLVLPVNSKVIISDFDKTLVDTKYSTPKEMYYSLRRPLKYFPTVEKSLHFLKHYIDQGYIPFILSASPHFYRKPFRDWLYQQGVYTDNIFLKDYRKVLSPLESELTTKDIKTQGFYKLNELVSIILMTGVPQELVVMGDGFESDPLIYLILRSLLVERVEPWLIWKEVKKLNAFKMSRKQQSHFLTNLHQLFSLQIPKNFQLKIKIRCRKSNLNDIQNRTILVKLLEQQKKFIEFYSA